MYKSIATPKRRHSSLFQRMQEEIEKISKKISAAKSHARHSSLHSNIRSFDEQKSNLKLDCKQPPKRSNIFINSRSPGNADSLNKTTQFNAHKQNLTRNLLSTEQKGKYRFKENHHRQREPSVIETVRIKPCSRKAKQIIDFDPFSDPSYRKLDFGSSSKSKTLAKRHGYVNSSTVKSQREQQILALERQNKLMSEQIEHLSKICEDQSYSFGYRVAELSFRNQKLNRTLEQCQGENIYLTKLSEHYKHQAKIYKEALKRYQQGDQSSQDPHQNSSEQSEVFQQFDDSHIPIHSNGKSHMNNRHKQMK